MRAPSSTVNDMSRKSGVAPNCFVIDCAFRIGGISIQTNFLDASKATGIDFSEIFIAPRNSIAIIPTHYEAALDKTDAAARAAFAAGDLEAIRRYHHPSVVKGLSPDALV